VEERIDPKLNSSSSNSSPTPQFIWCHHLV